MKTKKMVTSYNMKDMVSFGEYLLSDERRERYMSHPGIEHMPPLEDRLKEVSHADVENWKASLDRRITTDSLMHMGFVQGPECPSDTYFAHFAPCLLMLQVINDTNSWKLQVKQDGEWFIVFSGLRLTTIKELEMIVNSISYD